MTVIAKLWHLIQQFGFRGMIANILNHIAHCIDKKQLSNLTESQQNNEFLNWVRFAVPGMLEQRNIQAMEYAIVNMPVGKPILEIGSFCGLSTVVLSHLLDKHSKTTSIFTCDKWQFEGQRLGTPLGDSSSVTHDMYREYVKDTFLRSMETFAAQKLPHTIECFSDEFFSDWFENKKTKDVFDRPVTLGGEFSFCYIDGNHTYKSAKRDFENTDRALVSGGFVLFDDSADGSTWDVNQLTREIASGSQYELISRDPNYLFRKM